MVSLRITVIFLQAELLLLIGSSHLLCADWKGSHLQMRTGFHNYNYFEYVWVESVIKRQNDKGSLSWDLLDLISHLHAPHNPECLLRASFFFSQLLGSQNAWAHFFPLHNKVAVRPSGAKYIRSLAQLQLSLPHIILWCSSHENGHWAPETLVGNAYSHLDLPRCACFSEVQLTGNTHTT